MRMGVKLPIAAFCAALGLAGCGGGGDDAATPPPPTAPTTPPPVPTLTKEAAYPNMTFVAPVMMLQAPNDAARWFVVEQDGRVYSFANQAAVNARSVVVDLTDRVVSRNVHGLLGMAFHPGFPADKRVFFAYTHEVAAAVPATSTTAAIPAVIVLRVSQFTTNDNGNTIDRSTEQIIFELAQPDGHDNGGNLLFGSDGFLYFTPGDGGGDDQGAGPIGNGQLMTIVLGKMLRLDVDHPATGRLYGIPSDNPYAGNPLCGANGTGTQNCPEIYASGFRNPWRWSFDRQGGQLWVADVGAKQREEVNRVVKGGNYGWRCFEGTVATGFSCGSEPQAQMQKPVAEYDHTVGFAIIGGYVYRGTAMPGLVGRYVFGDYKEGKIWTIPGDTQPTLSITASTTVYASGLSLSSFAQDSNGEIYMIDRLAGKLYKLIAAP